MGVQAFQQVFDKFVTRKLICLLNWHTLSELRRILYDLVLYDLGMIWSCFSGRRKAENKHIVPIPRNAAARVHALVGRDRPRYSVRQRAAHPGEDVRRS